MSTSGWRVHETAHFIFQYAPNSYAAHRLHWLEERAETAWRIAHEFRGDDGAPMPKPHIHCDVVVPNPGAGGAPLVQGSYAVPATGEVWTVCRPESPAEGLEEAITHLLVFEPLAPAAGRVPFLRAGLVAALAPHGRRQPSPGRSMPRPWPAWPRTSRVTCCR